MELMVALSLTGLVLAGGWRLVEQLRQVEDRVDRDRLTDAAFANGARLLRSLIGRADASAETATLFVGDRATTSLLTWCDTPRGWLQRCRVAFTLLEQGRIAHLVASIENAPSIQLVDVRAPATFTYLDAAQEPSQWLERWSSSLTTPAALGIAMERDTVVLPIGVMR